MTVGAGGDPTGFAGELAGFGLVFGNGPRVPCAALADVPEDAGNESPGSARLVLQRAFGHWRELDDHLRWCDRQIGLHVRSSPEARRAVQLTGIGEIGG